MQQITLLIFAAWGYESQCFFRSMIHTMPEQPPETIGGGRNHRRSTISTISHDFRWSIVSTATVIGDRLHSHFVSTMALCSCVLTMFYLLMNCFPYSGFMAMSLVPGLTEESAGTYAGILSSSFMVGRAISSYPWGKIADVYGRKFVLVVSLLNSAVLSLAFGMSPTFFWAVACRFFMGLGNGIMLIARTSVSELARGDHELEARGMGLLMSMVGVSFSKCYFDCAAASLVILTLAKNCYVFHPFIYSTVCCWLQLWGVPSRNQ